MSVGKAAALVVTLATILLAMFHKMQCISFLKPDEQLVIESPSSITVVNGPTFTYFAPIINKASKRKALQLDEKSYATVKDTLTGERTVLAGPTLHFMGPYDMHEGTHLKLILTDRQFCRLLDTKSGKQRLVRGPTTVVPAPLETYSAGVENAIELDEMEYLVATDRLTGAQRIESGPQLLFPGVHDETEDKQRKLALKKNEYAKVVDEANGTIRVVAGPQVLVPAKATERLGSINAAFELLNHQYVKLLDQATGQLRVERGEAIIVPGPNEHGVGGVQDAVNVDDETAVLVMSKQSGQQRLVTEKGLFYPDKYDEILEVRKLVRVAPHEVAIARDNDGAFHFYEGNGAGNGAADAKGTAFFLQPHHELVTMMWSSGTSAKDVADGVVRKVKQVAYKVPVEKIDMRPQYAFFEYTVRTSDNVELVLEGQIFWQVTDVAKMIERTGDPKGDVWYHARSALIQAVSLVTLETFMASFNSIVLKAAAMDEPFYEERGVKLHNLEVVRFEPKDEATASVLQAIIQETTNHINRMQKQKSENEVEKEKMIALIDIEKQRTELITEKTGNEKLLQAADGEAEGTRLAQSTLAFMKQLETSVAGEEARVALLRFFAEQKTAVEHSRRYASNPQLTTVIEGGTTGASAQVKPVPEMRVEM